MLSGPWPVNIFRLDFFWQPNFHGEDLIFFTYHPNLFEIKNALFKENNSFLPTTENQYYFTVNFSF